MLCNCDFFFQAYDEKAKHGGNHGGNRGRYANNEVEDEDVAEGVT